MKSPFKSVDGVKRVAFPNLGGLHPINERPKDNKKVAPQARENSLLTALRMGHWLVFCLWAQTAAFALPQSHVCQPLDGTTPFVLLVLRPLDSG